MPTKRFQNMIGLLICAALVPTTHWMTRAAMPRQQKPKAKAKPTRKIVVNNDYKIDLSVKDGIAIAKAKPFHRTRRVSPPVVRRDLRPEGPQDRGPGGLSGQ